MWRVTVVALVLIAGLALPTSATAAWKDRFCGYMQVNGVSNEVHSSAPRRPSSCLVARSTLWKYLDTKRSRIDGWRCRGGGSNGAVLAQCVKGPRERPNRHIVIYDGRYGE